MAVHWHVALALTVSPSIVQQYIVRTLKLITRTDSQAEQTIPVRLLYKIGSNIFFWNSRKLVFKNDYVTSKSHKSHVSASAVFSATTVIPSSAASDSTLPIWKPLSLRAVMKASPTLKRCSPWELALSSPRSVLSMTVLKKAFQLDSFETNSIRRWTWWQFSTSSQKHSIHFEKFQASTNKAFESSLNAIYLTTSLLYLPLRSPPSWNITKN